MSGDLEQTAQCEAIADELMELAMGTSSGHRRSAVLDHVGSCEACRAELEQLSIVVESLQQLAPPMQPPLGFEVRLAERLRPTSTPRLQVHRRVYAMIAVAAAVVMLAFGLGALAARGSGNGKGQSSASALERANFTSQGQVLGELVVSPDNPAWMLVTVRDGAWKGTVTCNVTFAGGQVETIGVFKLSGEYGAWGAPLKSTSGQVRSAQLIAPDGAIVATAELGA